MYFGFLPYTYYSLDNNASAQVIPNITLKAVINDKVKNNYSVYDLYDIQEEETPELVSYKFYNTTDLHWLILHMNDIVDPRFEWPLTNYELIEYCNGKYDNPQATHHWVNIDGYIVSENTPGSISVSNFQFEDELNEEKRRIKILKPIYVQTIVNEVKESFSRVS